MDPTNPSVIRLAFLGQAMGRLTLREGEDAHLLEFDARFLQLGHDLSPVAFPLEQMATPRVLRAGESPFPGGLPGLLADSLPDAWGDCVMRAELPHITTLTGRLAAIGRRGPGAITFEPALGPGQDAESASVELAVLSERAAALASSIPAPLAPDAINAALAKGGSSLGGALPKTTTHLPISADVIDKQEILVGGPTPRGHVPCILKFAPADSEGGGAVEFAYLKMAEAAGIRVPHACMVNDGRRRHFAAERFDRYLSRDGAMSKRHVQTLSGLLHRRASEGQLDYSDFMRLARRLCSYDEAEECLRRAIFNLLALNRDDHGRNHAFLYDEKTRTWSLAPAYDLNPKASDVLIGLSWMGSAAVPQTLDDLSRMAELGGIRTSKVRTIFGEVETAVMGEWPRIAAESGVSPQVTARWEKEMLSQSSALRAAVAKAPTTRTARR